MSAPILSAPTGNLSTDLPGVWWLQSREDWTANGERREEPTLGSDPIAIVAYSKTHFAAQFMKRDRSAINLAESAGTANNTVAVGGYDAYFGTYQVDEKTGDVAHTLVGSISPANIGKTFARSLRIHGDILILQLQTQTAVGEPVTRTLTWQRQG